LSGCITGVSIGLSTNVVMQITSASGRLAGPNSPFGAKPIVSQQSKTGY
jgi:hypothetical protein